MSDVKCELYHDHFQNAKQYNLRPSQLLLADIPYNLGQSFYASNPSWWRGGRVENGESDKAHKAAFNTDFNFNIADFFAFGSRLLKKEPARGEKDAPCIHCTEMALRCRLYFSSWRVLFGLPDCRAQLSGTYHTWRGLVCKSTV